jgi:hypothetical protein
MKALRLLDFLTNKEIEAEQQNSAERELLLSVVWQAVKDWEDLIDKYTYNAHKNLHNFFYGDQLGYCGLDFVLDYFDNGEYVKQRVIKYIKRLGEMGEVNLNQYPDPSLVKRICHYCLNEHPLYQYRIINSTRPDNYGFTCPDCRLKGHKARSYDGRVKRQNRFLNNVTKYKSLGYALKGEKVDYMTLRDWKRDPNFIRMAKQKKVYSFILTKAENGGK